MADLIFNIAKGREVHYASLPATNDAFIAVVLEATGLEADGTLRDYDNLSALLAGTNNEQTTMGRKTLTGVAITVNDTTDTVAVTANDIVWSAASGNDAGALVVCYDPDTTAGDDTTLVPIVKYDFAVTPAGGDVTAQVATAGLYTTT